jgi:multidrug efflux pump subunit AcrB
VVGTRAERSRNVCTACYKTVHRRQEASTRTNSVLPYQRLFRGQTIEKHSNIMWIVRLALRQKLTFVVMALFIALLGVLAMFRTSTDIFPVIDVPVVTVIWQFTGLAPDDMEKRIVSINERAMTTTVNNVEHIESQSMAGVGVVKVYFQEGTNAQAGVAQVTAICQTLLKAMPPGITPPLILQYSATSVPVLQLGIGGPGVSEAQLYDLSQNVIRQQLVTNQGVSIPLPYGGKPRQIMVDLNIPALQAKGLSPADVDNALNAQNLILPAGTAKIAEREYNVRVNMSTNVVDRINDMPIKTVNGAIITIGDVAHVHDGYAVQTNIVDVNGQRASLLTVLKNGDASTLDVVSRIKAAIPTVKASLPGNVQISQLFDQSVFVRASVQGVIRESLIAAILTALMILLFLGSLRSTFVVAISIPLCILASLVILSAIGETINIMTLGGLALAVGILVDDATVEVENTNRNLAMGNVSLTRAILESAEQIAAPAFVSTLSICIVFVPIAFLTGAPRALFLPLALAVVFAMLSSYLLSRTLVPVMMQTFLRSEVDDIIEEESGQRTGCPEPVEEEGDEKKEQAGKETEGKREGEGSGGEGSSPQNGQEGREQNGKAAARPDAGGQASAAGQGHHGSDNNGQNRDGQAKKKKPGLVKRVHRAFNHRFEQLRDTYCAGLTWALTHRKPTIILFVLLFVVSLILIPFIGQDFFPTVDAGQLQLHAQAPAGTRIEETEHRFHAVENLIRRIIPANEIDSVIDNIGIPVGGVNLAFSNSAVIGSLDGDILVSLKSKHGSTDNYMATLRRRLPIEFSDMTFFFEAADITTQILNFGLPAPIDVQVVGTNPGNYALAQQLAKQMQAIPGAVDVHLKQVTDAPEIDLDVDRQRAQELNLTQRDVANELLISLSGSSQTAPNYWLDPKSGVSYLVAVQTPQYNVNSVDAMQNTPLVGGTSSGAAGTSGAGTSGGTNSNSLGAAQPVNLLGNVTTVRRSTSAQVINHYNVQPVFDILADTQGRDLGGVARDINSVIQKMHKKFPKATKVVVHGQVERMNSSFLGLGLGLIFAIMLVYLLMVVNFQSWLDPLVIIMALPGALSGILWMLFITRTTFSVPSLMGSIMCIGVATSNSILLITFANQRRAAGDSALTAAQAAGFTRFRPVLMTALALILGMLPMALGLGEGGEQNAPLGRAVIGGVTVATFTTLFFVPVIYAIFRRKQPEESDTDIEVDKYDADRAMTAQKKHEQLADVK